MKKNLINISLLAGGAMIAMSGCAPQLARTPYGPEEVKWQHYVQSTYGNWTPPPTPAPNADNTENASVEESTIEVVPEAATSDITTADLKTDSQAAVSSPEAHSSTPNTQVISSSEQTYVVKKGDTLWTISYKFYNSGSGWKKILDANKDQLPTPDKIREGMVLKIPAK